MFSTGEHLRSARLRRDLSIQALAAATGFSVEAIRAFERDRRSPTLAQLEAIAAALDMRFTWSISPKPPAPPPLTEAEERQLAYYRNRVGEYA